MVTTEKYPSRNAPDNDYLFPFIVIYRKKRTLRPQLAGNSGRPNMEAYNEMIINAIEETRESSTEITALSHMIVWRRLTKQLLHPYHLATGQGLLHIILSEWDFAIGC